MSSALEIQEKAYAMDGIYRLMGLRLKLFDAIGRALAEDGHCKSYEGTFSIRCPNYFEHIGKEVGDAFWAVGLDCYVVGPSRHYEWTGRTLTEAVSKAESDVMGWIEEWWRG